MPAVFISYAKEDRKIAEALQGLLHDLGVSAFYDQDIEHGGRWQEALRAPAAWSTARGKRSC
jgi:hypothetical protein